jgi:hypothetical protein
LVVSRTMGPGIYHEELSPETYERRERARAPPLRRTQPLGDTFPKRLGNVAAACAIANSGPTVHSYRMTLPAEWRSHRDGTTVR